MYIYSQGGGWCSLYLTMQYIYSQGGVLYLIMQYIYSQGGDWCSLYLTM